MGNVGGKAYHSSPGSNHVSRKELDRLQRRFSRLSNGQDRVSIRQLAAIPELKGNLFVQRLFELHDGDGDGVILHEEFLNALYAIRKLSSGGPEDQVKLAFKLYDLDGDGFVSADEIAKVLARTTAQGVPEAQLREAVAGAVAAHDADGDGRLAPPEFRDLVLASVSGQPAA